MTPNETTSGQAAPPAESPRLAHHFRSLQQQFDTGKLGMWTFLVSEILFFGGLFCAYAVYRANHPAVFVYAERFLDKTLGAVNTVVLIGSSLSMAWAVRCAQRDQRRGLVVCLALTLLAASFFLGVKGIEYRQKWRHGLLWAGRYAPTVEADHVDDAPPPDAAVRRNIGVFFSIYFLMTGLHAVHVVAGMGLIAWLLVASLHGRFGRENFAPVDFTGLYWHLVDLIWIYLFPLLYLTR